MIVKGKVKRLLSSFPRTVQKKFRWSSYKSRVLICVFDLSGSCVSKEGGYTCVCQGKNVDTYSEKYNINFFTVKDYKLPRYVSLNCQKKIVKCVLRNVLKCKVNFFIENIFILVCKEKIKPSLFSFLQENYTGLNCEVSLLADDCAAGGPVCAAPSNCAVLIKAKTIIITYF